MNSLMQFVEALLFEIFKMKKCVVFSYPTMGQLSSSYLLSHLEQKFDQEQIKNRVIQAFQTPATPKSVTGG